MRFNASRKRSASAYRVDDFEAVALAQYALRVLALRHDLAVDFDCHLALGVAFGIEQLADAEFLGHLKKCAVERDFYHRRSLTRYGAAGRFFAIAKKEPGHARALDCLRASVQ
jgi:hypothetical protein